MVSISKLFLSVFCASVGLEVSAQEYFVPTQISKKCVVLEEFTGAKCPNCPDGHKRSDQLKQQYKDRYIAVNIHQGSFANPSPGIPSSNYTTPFGDALADAFGVGGYPMGAVSRTKFPGQSNISTGRENWAEFVSKTVTETACVNLAAKSYLNWPTRELTCIVQGYYSSDSKEKTNYLNVAILQNNVIGQQQGIGYYPEMSAGDNKYRHNHMLRHFLTGQWGIPISKTQSGTYFSDTLRYTLPMDYKDVPLEMGNIDIVAYLTETKNNILNACESSIDYQGLVSSARLLSAKQAEIQNCQGMGAVEVKIKNNGEGRINAVSFDYIYNNKTYSCTWNHRHIMPGASDTMVLSSFPMVEGVTDVKVQITAVNGEAVSATLPLDSLKTIAIMAKKVGRSAGTKFLKLELNLDQYASEVSWQLLNGDGAVIAKKAYTEDLPKEGTKKYTEMVPIKSADCYLFEIFDKGKDGIHTNFGSGYYKIYDDQDILLAESDGKYTDKDYQVFSLGSVANEIEKNAWSNKMKVYPNPTKGGILCTLTLEKSASIQLSLFDLSGRKVESLVDKVYPAGTHEIAFDLSNLIPSMYILYMQSGQEIQTQKINIIK
ncbi:MAG: Omp28-related outer membrane protein [Bacteroidales bacterium]